MTDFPEITVLQLPKFEAEATELIGASGIEELATYLIEQPEAGDVIPGSGGVRKSDGPPEAKVSAAVPESSICILSWKQEFIYFAVMPKTRRQILLPRRRSVCGKSPLI